MVRGTTSSGFQFELDDEALDDYELLETLQKIDAGKYDLVPEMICRLLGEEQKEALKEHIRNENHKVSAKKLVAEVMEIFKASNQGKN